MPGFRDLDPLNAYYIGYMITTFQPSLMPAGGIVSKKVVRGTINWLSIGQLVSS